MHALGAGEADDASEAVATAIANASYYALGLANAPQVRSIFASQRCKCAKAIDAECYWGNLPRIPKWQRWPSIQRMALSIQRMLSAPISWGTDKSKAQQTSHQLDTFINGERTTYHCLTPYAWDQLFTTIISF